MCGTCIPTDQSHLTDFACVSFALRGILPGILAVCAEMSPLNLAQPMGGISVQKYLAEGTGAQWLACLHIHVHFIRGTEGPPAPQGDTQLEMPGQIVRVFPD